MCHSKCPCSIVVSTMPILLLLLFPHIGTAQSVTCNVFDDGYAGMSSPSDAIYLADSQKACVPSDSATGYCKRWFGRCATNETVPVYFTGFDDGMARQTGLSDAVYARAPH